MKKSAAARLLPIVDDLSKKDVIQRLNRVAGQIDGVKRMVEERRYCIEVLNQIASAQEALRGVSRAVMRRYLESCATEALRSADQAEAERIYGEIMDQLYKHAR